MSFILRLKKLLFTPVNVKMVPEVLVASCLHVFLPYELMLPYLNKTKRYKEKMFVEKALGGACLLVNRAWCSNYSWLREASKCICV